MKTGQATGLQIAFLMYAVTLTAVPVSDFLTKAGELEGASLAIIAKGTQFALAILVIAAFPRLRELARKALATPIPSAMQCEVVLVGVAKLSIAFGTAAGLALVAWWAQGSDGIARIATNADRESAKALSEAGLALLLLTSVVGPAVEELVFRGFIYPAFARQWGWIPGMLATSVLFGLYHPHFWSAFASSILFVCVLRRTGSLRAPILVHMFFNFMLWWPLLGQHVFPHAGTTSLEIWFFRIACLAFVVVALPIYVWMARDRNVAAPTVFLETNAALPK